MNKIILYVTLVFLLSGIANAEKYFVLDVNYILGSVTYNSHRLSEIDRIIKYADKSGFLVKTVSFEGSDIEKIYYNMSENKNYIVYIPYSENTARIEVYNPKNSKVIDIDVSSFSNTCGNNVCEEYESYESCTKDCKSGSKDDFCDEVKDGICDPDCSSKTDSDCAEVIVKEGNQTITTPITEKKEQKIELGQPKEKPNYFLWILLILAIVIFVLLILFVKKIKENQIINSLKQYIGENIRRGFTLQQIKDALYREGYTEKEIDKAIKSI